MELDKELLMRNLEMLPEVDEEMQNRSSMLRRLLLVIAGDQRVIGEMTLSDLGELFSMSTFLLEMSVKIPAHQYKEERLKDYMGCRRAV